MRIPYAHFVLILFGAAVVSSAAKDKPVAGCTFEELTRACGLFDPSLGEKLELADGSYLPRVSRDAEEPGGWLPSSEAIRSKFALSKLLGEIDDKKMHPLFKLFVLDRFSEVTPIIQNDKSEKGESVQSPWPMSDPGEPRRVEGADFLKAFKEAFSSTQWDQLKEIAKSSQFANVADRMREVTGARQLYVLKMVGFVKSRMLDVILQGRSEKSLNEEERNVLARVQSIQVADPAKDITIVGAPSLSSPFYTQEDHSLHLVPALFHYPDVTIVALVAREMARTLDPCQSQSDVYEIHGGKLAALKKTPHRDDDGVLERLRKISERSPFTAGPLFSTGSGVASDGSIRRLVSAGVLSIKAKGVPLSRYFLKDVYQCLKAKRGDGFRPWDPREIKRAAHAVTERRKQYREPAYDAKADEKNIEGIYASRPECIGPRERSALSQAVSDWISSKVLGEFLSGSGIHLKTDAERVAPIGYSAQRLCSLRTPQQQRGDSPLSLKYDFQVPFEVPGESKDRIEATYLAEKNIRAALGCTDGATKSCEHARAK